ncbi:MAG TPA: FHA domain-containing protein [Gallionellaceae bacterium]|nr:FHA domain-containing protein [Gallionellaceae bacterium]
MAAKLILSMDGAVLKEYVLNKERMTIGRKSHNDVVIDNLAVSGEHAAIVTILNDSFLEDLDSTNGVMVNGTQVKKHFLQNNDVIEIGKYKLKYLNDQPSQTTAADFERTMVLRAPAKKPEAAPTPMAQTQTQGRVTEATGKFPEMADTTAQHPVSGGGSPAAAVQILTGPNAGKELELVKNLTTLGKPGLQVAVLTRRPNGYFITHVEGATYPVLNGAQLDEHPHQLKDHDIIELAGIKMEFYFKS